MDAIHFLKTSKVHTLALIKGMHGAAEDTKCERWQWFCATQAASLVGELLSGLEATGNVTALARKRNPEIVEFTHRRSRSGYPWNLTIRDN